MPHQGKTLHQPKSPEATPCAKSRNGVASSDKLFRTITPSESDSLVNTRQPDLLGVTQIAALRASSRALARFDAETFQRRVNCYIVTFVSFVSFADLIILAAWHGATGARMLIILIYWCPGKNRQGCINTLKSMLLWRPYARGLAMSGGQARRPAKLSPDNNNFNPYNFADQKILAA